METKRLFITLLFVIAAVQTVFSGDKIVVVGQNVENFYYSLDLQGNSNTKRQAKMDAIVNAYFPSDNSVPIADIYAFCEVECSDEMMQYIASSFKAKTGLNFQASLDGLTYDKSYYSSGVIKCGFVYNADKIKAVGDNVTTAIDNTGYTARMRMQTFMSKASGECFTLSMNHFKAFSKDASQWDNDRQKRLENAIDLLKGLKKNYDPDILIMGDLNSEMGEACLDQLVNAGYDEQLIKYAGPTAWTHCYGGGEIIDHVFANSTMAQQVTDVEVKAANYCSLADETQAFSDHNFYVVTLDLKEAEFHCEDIAFSESFSTDFGQFTTVNTAGTKEWVINTSYSCANINAYQNGINDDWLISPMFDLRQKNGATLTFDQCAGYGVKTAWTNQMQVLVSDNYFDHIGKPGEASWTVLGAVFDTSANYKWKGNTISIPNQFVGKDKVFIAFHYTCGESDIPSWEVKNVELTATCSETGISTVNVYSQPTVTRKIMENGRMVIVTPNGSRYNVQGMKIK